jgi:hypothetical protein
LKGQVFYLEHGLKRKLDEEDAELPDNDILEAWHTFLSGLLNDVEPMYGSYYNRTTICRKLEWLQPLLVIFH